MRVLLVLTALLIPTWSVEAQSPSYFDFVRSFDTWSPKDDVDRLKWGLKISTGLTMGTASRLARWYGRRASNRLITVLNADSKNIEGKNA